MKTNILVLLATLVIFAIVGSIGYVQSERNDSRVRTMMEEKGFITEDNKHYYKNSVECVLNHSIIVCGDDDHIGWASTYAVDDSWMESLMKVVEA